MPRKLWVPLEEVDAADLNLVADQSVMTFPSTAARAAAIPQPDPGMVTFVDGRLEVFYADHGWSRPWHEAWGVPPQSAAQPLDIGAIDGNARDVQGYSLTWTTTPNRLYQVTAWGNVRQDNDPGAKNLALAVAGGGAIADQSISSMPTWTNPFVLVGLYGGNGGTVTFTVRAACFGGYMTMLGASIGGGMWVTDIGPAGGAAALLPAMEDT